MAFLDRLFPRRDFSLPQFDLRPLQFELGINSEKDELVLDRPVYAAAPDSNVIALGRRLPTAGELRESIERHLQGTSDSAAPAATPDPADELREALFELRRPLR